MDQSNQSSSPFTIGAIRVAADFPGYGSIGFYIDGCDMSLPLEMLWGENPNRFDREIMDVAVRSRAPYSQALTVYRTMQDVHRETAERNAVTILKAASIGRDIGGKGKAYAFAWEEAQTFIEQFWCAPVALDRLKGIYIDDLSIRINQEAFSTAVPSPSGKYTGDEGLQHIDRQLKLLATLHETVDAEFAAETRPEHFYAMAMNFLIMNNADPALCACRDGFVSDLNPANYHDKKPSELRN